jgi:ABC-type antimicrobial peptide transport system permease subunit
MPGVKGAIGVTGFPVKNVREPTRPLIVLAVNPQMLPITLVNMAIDTGVLKRWYTTRVGAICDHEMARQMGWRVDDRITVPLMTGMHIASSKDTFELVLLGTYPAGLTLSGLVIRYDYFIELIPQNKNFSFIFVKPRRAADAHAIAQSIDETFKSGLAQTLSAPMYELKMSSAKDASTIRLATIGALAVSIFTMILIVTNALTQSTRERIGEMAVMEALGFRRSAIMLLVLAEASVLFAVGAFFGLGISSLGFTFHVAGLHTQSILIPQHTALLAALFAAVSALVAAGLPLLELSRLQIADALRRL